MGYFAGIDVSMQKVNVCIVDQEGRIEDERIVPNDVDKIDQYFKNRGLPMENIGIETGAGCGWLTKELRRKGHRVTYIDSRKMSALIKVNPNKTDRNDARAIAQAIRTGMYREAHAKSDEAVDKKTLLIARRELINTRTEYRNRIRGLIKDCGVKLGPVSAGKFVEGVRSLFDDLPTATTIALECLLRIYGELLAQAKELDRLLRQLVKDDKRAQLLMTAPGIGPVTALQFLVEIDEESRFKRSRAVGAYVGMAPRQYSSGEITRQGRISKCGPGALRSYLTEAGLVLMTRYRGKCHLKSWGLQVKKRHGIHKAAVAVGRKLSVILHRMLVTGEPFCATGEGKREQLAA